MFPCVEVNSQCKKNILMIFSKFPVFAMSGKIKIQIFYFKCTVATLNIQCDRHSLIKISLRGAVPIAQTKLV